MKRITAFIVYATKKDDAHVFRITPNKSVADEIVSNFPDKTFITEKKYLTDGELANLLIDHPWAFDKDDFKSVV